MIEVEKTISIYEIVAIFFGLASFLFGFSSFAWLVIKWRKSKKTVTVRLDPGLSIIGELIHSVFIIKVINHTDTPRRIEEVGFGARGRNVISLTPGTAAQLLEKGWLVELPKLVPSKDNESFKVPSDEIKNHPELKRPIKAWVRDSLGKRYFSNKIRGW
jgi:hypothetical protein